MSATPTDYAKLRELAEAATPGPWQSTSTGRVSESAGMDTIASTRPDMTASDARAPEQMEADADFIAAANPATVLALLDTIAALQAERNAAYERAAKVCDDLHSAQTINNQEHHAAWHDGVDACVAAIRAQEQTKDADPR